MRRLYLYKLLLCEDKHETRYVYTACVRSSDGRSYVELYTHRIPLGSSTPIARASACNTA